MLTLYHDGNTVCSIKARVALAEKGLEWQSAPVDLKSGAQFQAEFLRLNPEGVVPVLVDGDFVLSESSAIIEYVDQLTPENPLMPQGAQAQAETRMWLIRCIPIHAAINTLSFASVFRARQLAMPREKVMAMFAAMPNPEITAKRIDIFENGMASVYVDGALATLTRTFDWMQGQLEQGAWLGGPSYGLADVALLAYVDRLDNLAFSGLWTQRYCAIGDWLARARARPSYDAATAEYINAAERADMRKAGEATWPDLAAKL
ncbi:MAG: glutathione S-transferase family protein [Pseudomonadota bacterium]